MNWELSINHFVAANEWFAQIMDYYYATLHFVVTIVGDGVAVRQAPARVPGRAHRAVLHHAVRTARLLSCTRSPRRGCCTGYSYVDTLLKFHTWGSLADPKVAAHSNQFAAMPSLHIGWALWCGIAIFMCARRTWVRVAGLAYPCFTLA